MLRPNVVMSRKYTDVATGDDANMLLVQCRDARDLFGHYPPVCYVAQGYKLVLAKEQDWLIGALPIHGMVYTFSSTRPDDLDSIIVYNCMILPNGNSCRDMEGVYASARDPQRRRFGAAELQMLVGATIPVERRDALFTEIVGSYRGVIEAILAGDK